MNVETIFDIELLNTIINVNNNIVSKPNQKTKIFMRFFLPYINFIVQF